MNIIDTAKEKALQGITLTKEEIIKLLEIPLDSKEDKELREAAYEVAMKKLMVKLIYGVPQAQTTHLVQ